jgi:hypothetical protein
VTVTSTAAATAAAVDHYCPRVQGGKQQKMSSVLQRDNFWDFAFFLEKKQSRELQAITSLEASSALNVINQVARKTFRTLERFCLEVHHFNQANSSERETKEEIHRINLVLFSKQ